MFSQNMVLGGVFLYLGMGVGGYVGLFWGWGVGLGVWGAWGGSPPLGPISLLDGLIQHWVTSIRKYTTYEQVAGSLDYDNDKNLDIPIPPS